jgi:hypothetical protein
MVALQIVVVVRNASAAGTRRFGTGLPMPQGRLDELRLGIRPPKQPSPEGFRDSLDLPVPAL